MTDAPLQLWPRSVVVVVDTSALLEDLRHCARTGMGVIYNLALAGLVFAPVSVLLEGERKLSRLAGNGISESSLRELWQDYRDVIRTTEAVSDQATGPAVVDLMIRDPSDVVVVAAAAVPRQAVRDPN